MAVYVDELRTCIPNQNWQWTKSCHMVADSIDELHAFATALGLKRSWFQCPASGKTRIAHYDLTQGKRSEAIALGATVIDRREFVRRLRASKQELA